MGVKSTDHVTREDAVSRLVQAELDALRPAIELFFTSRSKEHLEELLEELNDKEHGGEGFANYIIHD